MIHIDKDGKMTHMSQSWSIEDIEDRIEALGKDFTDGLAYTVLEALDRCFDASIGINWDVIDTHIEMSSNESS